MKYLCIDKYSTNFGIGDDLTNAYTAYKDNLGDLDAEDCTFYELHDPIKIEVQLIPKIEKQITEVGRLSKSKK